MNNRNFPTDWCDKCGRDTGTDFVTGLCGACILKVFLKKEPEPMHNKENWLVQALWIAPAVLLIGWILFS